MAGPAAYSHKKQPRWRRRTWLPGLARGARQLVVAALGGHIRCEAQGEVIGDVEFLDMEPHAAFRYIGHQAVMLFGAQSKDDRGHAPKVLTLPSCAFLQTLPKAP